MADATLVATTRRLDDDVDLLTIAGSDGVLVEHESKGLAGRGIAHRIRVGAGADAAAEVHAALGHIEVDDKVGLPGCGPVAFGALPFAPDAAKELVIPQVVVGRGEDGTRWLTTIGPADAPPELTITPLPPESVVDPGPMQINAARASADWCAALEAGRDRIRSGELSKFVLAREVHVSWERPIARQVVLARLRAAYPTCYITSIGPMIGASPELLLSRRGDIVRTRPLAGTAPRSPDPTADARLAASLLASSKDREEHRIVIDMLHDTLLPWCSYLDAEPEPSVVGMANVQHLATYLEGRLSSPAASALELVQAVHPTPAVGGTPRDVALAVIAELEAADRGAYAGPVGWVDASGNGDWVVGIRSAELDDTSARVFAGVGVVADSDPVAELAETRAKFQAILSALLRP
jgi:isochorismate synthase